MRLLVVASWTTLWHLVLLFRRFRGRQVLKRGENGLEKMPFSLRPSSAGIATKPVSP